MSAYCFVITPIRVLNPRQDMRFRLGDRKCCVDHRGWQRMVGMKSRGGHCEGLWKKTRTRTLSRLELRETRCRLPMRPSKALPTFAVQCLALLVPACPCFPNHDLITDCISDKITASVLATDSLPPSYDLSSMASTDPISDPMAQVSL
jgi:hypothetical protein